MTSSSGIRIKSPCSTKRFLLKYKCILSPLEKREVKKLVTIYYYIKKRIHNNTSNPRRTDSFSDGSGYYPLEIGGHINYRYQVLNVLGQGSYGRVLSAYDHQLKRIVAIKNLNKYVYSCESHMQKEVSMLYYLRTEGLSEFVVTIQEHFSFRNNYFIVFEKLNRDLNSLIENKVKQQYGQELLNHLTCSLFRALYFLQQKSVLHCDIKPDNIFFSAKGNLGLKLGDFGMSCFFHEIEWHYGRPALCYRAPEIILRGKLTPAIDVWSVACTVAETALGAVLFPGTDEEDVFTAMVERLGIPPEAFLKSCDSNAVAKYVTSTGFPKYIVETVDDCDMFSSPKRSKIGRQLCYPGELPLSTVLQGEDPLLIDLLERCLQWDVNDRMPLEQVINHSYLRRRLSKCIPEQEFPRFTQSMVSSLTHKSGMEGNSVGVNNNRPWSGAF